MKTPSRLSLSVSIVGLLVVSALSSPAFAQEKSPAKAPMPAMECPMGMPSMGGMSADKHCMGEKGRGMPHAKMKGGMSHNFDTPAEATAMANTIEEHFNTRMKAMHDELKITAKQEEAWKQFAEARKAMLPKADELLARSKAHQEAMKSGNTPEQARQNLSEMRGHLDKFQAVVDSYDKLYKNSSKEQQALLVKLHEHPMGDFGGGKMDGHRPPFAHMKDHGKRQ